MAVDPTDEAAATDSTGTAAAGEEPVLETVELTRQFGELLAVDGVDLAVERGEFRSVIGPNGAGKTTLFDLLSGALAPTSGTVRFGGEDVTDLSAFRRVRRGMGRSFQVTNVFGGLTVRENVRFAAQGVHRSSLSVADRLFRDAGDFEPINDRTAAVLDRVGLADQAAATASTLAYGDRRRLELGLVLATDPSLVLLDEPTAGMSPEETRETLRLVREVLADRTLLLIEHDVDLVLDVSDRITVLHRGRELATGTPDEIAADDDVQDAYMGGHRG